MAALGVRSAFGMAVLCGCALAASVSTSGNAHAQVSSVSAWDAADFRIWGYVPNWTTPEQIASFSTNGTYDHVSDVLYFGGVQPKADGSLHYWYGSSTRNAVAHLAALKSHATTHGFRLHSSMFTV